MLMSQIAFQLIVDPMDVFFWECYSLCRIRDLCFSSSQCEAGSRGRAREAGGAGRHPRAALPGGGKTRPQRHMDTNRK